MTTPSDTAREIVAFAKGGISFAGIDERILIPNIIAALSKADAAAYARGIEDAARVAECDCCDVCGESPGYPKCANVIAEEIRALAGRAALQEQEG